jgi:hypothetical protein
MMRAVLRKEHSIVSAPTTTSKAAPWQWPVDVVAYAKEEKVEQHLNPVLEATWRVFPMARRVRVTLEVDPELRDQKYIVFDVDVPRKDVSNFVDLVHRWNDEEKRIVPNPRTSFFVLSVNVVS